MLVARDWGRLISISAQEINFRASARRRSSNPDAPLDPGAGNNSHIESNFVYQPTDALRLSLNYFKEQAGAQRHRARRL